VIRRWDADRRLARLYGAAPSDLAREGARHLAAIEAGGRLVGLIGLSGISPVTRSAELRVLIGRAEDRGQGFGRAAVQAYLGRVREAFNLSHVYVRVLAGNRPALRCFESCGFRRIGVLRVRHDRRYADPPLPDDVVLLTL
jgi:RimJ/RimL family protein N-acetyltransferase